MKHLLPILVFLSFINIGFLSSQNINEGVISTNLVKEGFKNINLIKSDNDLIVFFENSIYRSDLMGIAEVLKIVSPNSDKFKEIHIVVLKSNVPIIFVSVSSDNLHLFLNSDSDSLLLKDIIETGYNVSQFIDNSVKSTRQNSTRFFTDIIVKPDIGFQLGNYDDPFKFQLNLHPEVDVSLWSGQNLGIKINLPLIEKKFVDKFNYVRPETVTFEQLFRVSNGVFGRLSLGLFSNQRYGLDLESGIFLLNGKVLLHGNIAYTGYMAYLKDGTPGIYGEVYSSTLNDLYSKNVLEKSELNSFQYFGDIEYRFSELDLSVKLGYGEYLYHNKAFSFEMLRNFEEFIIGFRGYSGSTGNTFEGRLIIPLIPDKYLNKQKLRVRMAGFYEYNHPIGSAYYRTFESGLSLERKLWELNPQFIKNNLHKYF